MNGSRCAVAGNDPNVGRLASSIGDYIGSGSDAVPSANALAACRITMGGRLLCEKGKFVLDHEAEAVLQKHMQDAEQVTTDSSGKPIYPDYPPHRRQVEIEVALGRGDASATILGSDLTHEYVTINGDYRS
eukprot:COSAG05_NODE_599_length_8442_cov_52.187268_6_plen_131_part_00